MFSKSTTPRTISSDIIKMLDLLDLTENDAHYVKYTNETSFTAEFENCHVNNLVKRKLYGGELVFGWIIWENKDVNFIEANFHSLWTDGKKKLYDITPRRDKEEFIFFVQDGHREIEFIKHSNSPAIKTFNNLRIQNGQIITGINSVLAIMTSPLIREYGLLNDIWNM